MDRLPAVLHASIRTITKPISAITATPPTKPNSSAITLKMKSVWRTRKKRRVFCGP